MNIGFMDFDRHGQSKRINNDMLLSAFDILAPIDAIFTVIIPVNSTLSL
jgi:hypothetical protein